jgi:hypothetical protein
MMPSNRILERQTSQGYVYCSTVRLEHATVSEGFTAFRDNFCSNKNGKMLAYVYIVSDELLKQGVHEIFVDLSEVRKS